MVVTAAQRRAREKGEYDAFLALCPSRQLLDRISDKWVTLVLCALGGDDTAEQGTDGPDARPGRVLRYSELSRQLAGVSQKMLTQTLRSLERDGLVARTVTPTVPVTVTYELTDLGASLREAVRTVKAWAETYMDDVLAHRAHHDESRPSDAATALTRSPQAEHRPLHRLPSPPARRGGAHLGQGRP